MLRKRFKLFGEWINWLPMVMFFSNLIAFHLFIMRFSFDFDMKLRNFLSLSFFTHLSPFNIIE
jgi:hypothetical protein